MDSAGTNREVQIIVVDDDQLVRDFAVHTIEYGINRKITTFETGFNAWQFLQKRPDDTDIVIADANIPDMDGIELLKKVKEEFPEKKFVLTTSNPDFETIASKMGADAFLSKPYDVNDLFTIVQQFFAIPARQPNHPESDSLESDS
ncbi:MAG: response regulator [Desulfobacteraceae bacterium]